MAYQGAIPLLNEALLALASADQHATGAEQFFDCRSGGEEYTDKPFPDKEMVEAGSE